MAKNKIPAITTVLVLLTSIIASLFLLKDKKILNLKASTNINPKDIRISNITDASFTVSWITDTKTAGYIKWGKSNIDKTAHSTQNNKSYIHWIKIDGLSPSTTYNFNIYSERFKFDNNGIAWEVTTGPTIKSKAKSNIISGKIAAKNKALVYATIGGSSLLSTTTFQDGGWIIPISNARNQTLSSYININNKSSLIEIFVQAPPEGFATAQIYPESAKPVPTMILGETYNTSYYANYNFKNINEGNTDDIPNSSIIFPENSTNPPKPTSY